MQKYCQICGKEIQRPLLKYCFDCKEEGYKRVRKEWHERQKTPCIDCGKLSVGERCHDCNSKIQGKKIRKKRVRLLFFMFLEDRTC